MRQGAESATGGDELIMERCTVEGRSSSRKTGKHEENPEAKENKSYLEKLSNPI